MPELSSQKGENMGNIEKMIEFAQSKKGKVGYSMAYPDRLGPEYMDCSSFVYYSLIAGGFLPSTSIIGNTESLYKLKGSVLREIYNYKDVKRGDIFIRGVEGKSYGAYGHTGIFLRKGSIIHCNYTNRGVSINDESSYLTYYLDCKRSEEERYFRLIGGNIWREKIKKGVAYVREATNVRSAPSTTSQIVALYQPNDIIYYDKLLENEGYHWLSYIGLSSGKRRYVAYGDTRGNRWIDV